MSIHDSSKNLGSTGAAKPTVLTRRAMIQGAAATVSLTGAKRLIALGARPAAFIADILRPPDAVQAFLGETSAVRLGLEKNADHWSAAGVEVTFKLAGGGATILLHSPANAVQRVHLRWACAFNETVRVLGDAWERSYGDLAWQPMQAERPLPWYCLLNDGMITHGIGVQTGSAAFAFWQIDECGISLWLDVRNGGCGVRLGDRALALATVVTHRGERDESAFHAARRLCAKMAQDLQKSQEPKSLCVFGSNDWYYAYGRNTADGILRDADLMHSLAPAGPVRPFTVVDDGYQDRRRFPDMAVLAEQIRGRGVLPGIWVRPLRAGSATRRSWLLPASRFGRLQGNDALAFDPTVPDALNEALSVVREARDWGYNLIKHDYTTYELLGQWGSQMGASPTIDGWSFYDRSRTNAEIISQLYRDIRTAAGEDRIIVGCNTVGHLAAGILDAQRTGDDVSGRAWDRTRRMGVNTLAFRLPQHRIFYANDPDCVPITQNVPWSFTEQWLRAAAASGTVLLVSPEPGSVGQEQMRALRSAFALCATGKANSEPLDWMTSSTPEKWSNGAGHVRYAWTESGGVSPFAEGM